MSTRARPEPDLAGNVILEPQALHMEILDTATRNVWQALEPTTRAAYEALELEPGLVRVGVGRGAMDASWFRRSPGAPADGPMRERSIGGHRFHFCARPLDGPSLPAGPDGPRELRVEKHHSLVFRAGGKLGVLRLPDHRKLVHVIEGGSGKKPPVLPDAWKLREVELDTELVIELPCPTLALFFANGDSYQGPIEVDAFAR